MLSTGRHSNTTVSITAIKIAVIAPALRAGDVFPCAVSKGGGGDTESGGGADMVEGWVRKWLKGVT